MDTAFTFSDTEVGTATPAGTLLPADVEMQVHCNHCRITASFLMGTLSYFITYCIHLGSHYRHCMRTAFSFRDRAWGSATTAGTLLPADVEMQAHCNYGSSLHPLHWHCINIPGQCLWFCNHCGITASTFMGTASSVTTNDNHLV